LDFEEDPKLSNEQQSQIDQLTVPENEAIESALLSECSLQWQKVSKIIGSTMGNNRDILQNIPDIYLASILYNLVESSVLEVQGSVGRMRHCEVRLKKTL